MIVSAKINLCTVEGDKNNIKFLLILTLYATETSSDVLWSCHNKILKTLNIFIKKLEQKRRKYGLFCWDLLKFLWWWIPIKIYFLILADTQMVNPYISLCPKISWLKYFMLIPCSSVFKPLGHFHSMTRCRMWIPRHKFSPPIKYFSSPLSKIPG